jgi:preprotein translocase subunit SecY
MVSVSNRFGFRYSNFFIMMSRFRFVFAVFYFTAILIFAVYLRSANNRIFYEFCRYRGEQSRLKQKLGTKQLLLEGLINPAAISQRLEPPLAE